MKNLYLNAGTLEEFAPRLRRSFALLRCLVALAWGGAGVSTGAAAPEPSAPWAGAKWRDLPVFVGVGGGLAPSPQGRLAPNQQELSPWQPAASFCDEPLPVRLGLAIIAPPSGMPPDTMGAVGENHVVLMINFRFRVFQKNGGLQVTNISLDQFWINGGVTPGAGPTGVTAFDPRIIYDPSSRRWFAAATDSPRTNNNIMVAVSATADPTGAWTAFAIDSDPANLRWADFPTLGTDMDGVYLAANMFSIATNPPIATMQSFLVLPKAGLLAAVPTVANRTLLPNVANVGFAAQPVFDLDNGGLPARIYAQTAGNTIKRSSFLAPINAPTIDTAGGNVAINNLPGPVDAVQPVIPAGGTVKSNINTLDSRLSSNVLLRNGVIWGVHSVSVGGRAALRWFRINEAANTLLEEGLIADPELAFFYPSIGVNRNNQAVIGFSGSGTNLPVSTFAAVGQTVAGVTTFGAPRLLLAGVDDFQQLDTATPPRNRWGDYSATVSDPVIPGVFWTFQEFVSADDTYSLQIQQIVVGDEPDMRVNAALDYEVVCVGKKEDSVVSIFNTGCGDLIVTNVLVVLGGADYSVLPNPVRPFVVQRGSHVDVTVRFAPTSAGAKPGRLRIVSNDPVRPVLDIDMTGEGGVGRIATVIADNGGFGPVCVGSFKDLSLTVHNNGDCNLNIVNILIPPPPVGISEFQIPMVMTFPLRLEAGNSIQLPIRFQPTRTGFKMAEVIVATDDPERPLKTNMIFGSVPSGDIRVTGSTDFGLVCAALPEKTISICNVGLCDLRVTNVYLTNLTAQMPCRDFVLVNSPFPTIVSHDFCIDAVIRFTPMTCGAKSCTLVIESDDPDTGRILVTIAANSPCADIDVPPDLGFAPEVIQSDGACTTALPFPISNKGECNLYITAITIGGVDAGDFSLSGLPSFPIILQAGHIAGEGDLNVVFAPNEIERAREATITVTYLLDPVAGVSASVTRKLCGEGVHTGARVLVTYNGIPVPQVERIHLQRINANRNKPQLDTQDNANRLPLVTVIPPAPCEPFQYHSEYGTVANPIQLLPGSYQITVAAIINGKRQSKSVGFNVDTCDFNANIVVRF